jgi:polyhydroxyalkanoate synthesis regulator phasin
MSPSIPALQEAQQRQFENKKRLLDRLDGATHEEQLVIQSRIKAVDEDIQRLETLIQSMTRNARAS